MIDAVFVVLFQVAAGAPVAPPAPEAAPVTEAQSAATETAAQTQDQEAAERRRRCRREASTGSRLPVARCSSASEDAAVENDSRSFLNRAQSQIPLNSN